MSVIMFRLRCATSCPRRLLHVGTVNRDQVLEQLQVCPAEDQVLDVVGKNKAKLTVSHVSCALEMLCQFQRDKPLLLRTEELKSHPQFLTLRIMAEHKIPLMDDLMLVDMLYHILRLNVEPHDSLVQQLVLEAWLRIDGLPMSVLSKFANCLSKQFLHHSPLMGQITRIVDQKLASIDDARTLSSLMKCTSSLVSPRLQDALISRVYDLLDTMDPSNYNTPRRVVKFMLNTKCSHPPLLEKCNQIFLLNLSRMDAVHIKSIMEIYQSLQFNNNDFRLAVRKRLIELIDSSTDPYSYTKLFVALAPMANLEIREGLENTAFLLADEFSAWQALSVFEALAEIQSRNLGLMNKIASVIQGNLHVYKPMQVAKITQALYLLKYQNPELSTKLRIILVNFLQCSVLPREVAMLTRSLLMLPSQRVEEAVMSRIETIVTQCNFKDLNLISSAIAKWLRNDTSFCNNTPGRYVRLMTTLNRCRLERLQTADRLDLMLEELKHNSGDWAEEMLLQETMVMLQRMMDQINWTNVQDLALFLTKKRYLCPPLMQRIASVATKDIDKIHYSATFAILLPFCFLNYDSAQVDELRDVCIRHFTPRISSFEPHVLVFLAYWLAVAECFPEELVREIFSIDFLGKLDSELETLPENLNMLTQRRLIELNRAVCLECPEFQVPWFHERVCQQMQNRGKSMPGSVLQQIHKMLAEVLGGINYVQKEVIAPYCYTINIECILDKHLQPLPYSNWSKPQILDREEVHWGTSSLKNIKHELPPGAQRVAVNILKPSSFCKNSHHLKGSSLMKKRHLEILGYRVIQIPHFEWNSMELSTPDAWKEYLRKKIFGELSS
ncbi:FAST kinase domain-containing protein 1, mitochondrial [Scophthalmus maximus]|uniref:FAST kinase domain-containing protein 1, mitochondrial n=1 Tax=Scophthalmus maximus TaxID=52904 RepID=UPI001FA903E0|nr:FAST kinase domain-containing protein 1, mitochondrial [Scophthalmus maximus]XP_035507201.2 FAST kinase domain-containing protein 1, mitochondrial [Scophthalmus maximus]XP_035507202.2 FAST kinase domain-containing protein 1, mitochondrial [Scophthalmus maximus]